MKIHKTKFYLFRKGLEFGPSHLVDAPPPPKGSWKPKYRMRNWTESRNGKGTVVVVLVAIAISNRSDANNLSSFLFFYFDMVHPVRHAILDHVTTFQRDYCV
jgi:hypothetical protein